MRVILDFAEDVWDFILDHAKWVGAGAAVLLVVGIVLVVVLRGCGFGPGGEAPTGRSREERSRDMTLDLGGGVKMDFVWITDIDGWMGKYEVTNGQFRRFKPDHDSGKYNDYDLNTDSQPVVYVS